VLEQAPLGALGAEFNLDGSWKYYGHENAVHHLIPKGETLCVSCDMIR